MVTRQSFFIRLFLKHHHNWVVSSRDPHPRICLKNGFSDICPKPKIYRLPSRLFTSIWQDKKLGSPRDFRSYFSFLCR